LDFLIVVLVGVDLTTLLCENIFADFKVLHFGIDDLVIVVGTDLVLLDDLFGRHLHHDIVLDVVVLLVVHVVPFRVVVLVWESFLLAQVAFKLVVHCVNALNVLLFFPRSFDICLLERLTHH
jgi:hypothetical protein